ncbi:MAG: hypothetical protein WAS21_22600 [Geminicoccaceae bacterium]
MAAALFSGAPAAFSDALLCSLLVGSLLSTHIFTKLRLYDLQQFAQPHRQIAQLLAAWAITVVAVFGLFSVTTKGYELLLLWLGNWLLMGTVGLVGMRLVLQHRAAREHVSQQGARVAVVGDVAATDDCLRRLFDGHELGDVHVKLITALRSGEPIFGSDLDQLKALKSSAW